nr:hypothetical protein [Gammaproteobacteria bacterium]
MASGLRADVRSRDANSISLSRTRLYGTRVERKLGIRSHFQNVYAVTKRLGRAAASLEPRTVSMHGHRAGAPRANMNEN